MSMIESSFEEQVKESTKYIHKIIKEMHSYQRANNDLKDYRLRETYIEAVENTSEQIISMFDKLSSKSIEEQYNETRSTWRTFIWELLKHQRRWIKLHERYEEDKDYMSSICYSALFVINYKIRDYYNFVIDNELTFW